ncbi:arginyltransferase [Thiosocius teredinicola]|uniref:arginyltransferase n=1 Tax=Thiosocius teredinicola TaxID=1973002 RepID=UPI0009912BDA
MNRMKRHLPLYLSAPHACSYLPGRQSNTLFTDPDQAMDMSTYSELLRYGFRRSGSMVYSPRCDHCQQCVSVRVPVDDFAPRRAHRRVIKANRDIEVYDHPAVFNDEHYALYQRYTRARHEDGDMANASSDDYMSFLQTDWCDTQFLEFRRSKQLMAVAVTDMPTDGLSAVYTFFDPDYADRSLGTFAILSQIRYARARRLSYLYLGYWIQECRKMAYKVNFRPIELWQQGQWLRLEAGVPLPS